MDSIVRIVLISALASASAQVRNTSFENQPALAMANERLELTIFVRGTTMANLVMTDDSTKLSPYWNPVRMQRELGRASQTDTPSFGHFVCVDGFGPVSPEERAAGLPGHGEAHLQNFETIHSGKNDRTTTLTLRAKLPLVQEVFTRTFRMVDGEDVVYVDSQLENLLGFDRPINWAEHATIGSPFLESGFTVVELSGKRSCTRTYEGAGSGRLERRLASGQDFEWPMAPGLDGKRIDLRIAPENPHYLDHAATLLDPARDLEWVVAFHPKKRLVLGYIFR